MLSCRSGDSFYDGFIQTVRINSSQPLTGQTAADPRVIPALPFLVTDSIAQFADNYNPICSAAAANDLPVASTAAAAQGMLCYLQPPSHVNTYTANPACCLVMFETEYCCSHSEYSTYNSRN